jgi:hypothetical protein
MLTLFFVIYLVHSIEQITSAALMSEILCDICLFDTFYLTNVPEILGFPFGSVLMYDMLGWSVSVGY